MAEEDMEIFLGSQANIFKNTHGGWYHHGKEISTEKKLAIEVIYRDFLCSENRPPSIRELARKAKISTTYSSKIIKEIKETGHIIPVSILKKERANKNPYKGVGAQCLCRGDQQVLLDLRKEDPTRTNLSYVVGLQDRTGTTVSESFISRFFKNVGPYDASQHKASLIPIDKYRPKNIKTYDEYLHYVADLPAEKIKFGDEKSIKGHKLWARKARPDPFAGKLAGTKVPSDFRNTYCVMGLCSSARDKAPFVYTIGSDNNDSGAFLYFIIQAVATGWLSRGDFLVVDNATVHSGGNTDILQEYLWHGKSPFDGMPLNIFVIPFPTRSPELNPIELLWHIFVRRMKRLPADIQLYKGEGLKTASMKILDEFSHNDVTKCLNRCGYYD